MLVGDSTHAVLFISGSAGRSTLAKKRLDYLDDFLWDLKHRKMTTGVHLADIEPRMSRRERLLSGKESVILRLCVKVQHRNGWIQGSQGLEWTTRMSIGCADFARGSCPHLKAI
jgi:hypothetical protein